METLRKQGTRWTTRIKALLEAAEGGMDGTGAKVAELGDCEQELGAALFQGGQGIGHGASFV